MVVLSLENQNIYSCLGSFVVDNASVERLKLDLRLMINCQTVIFILRHIN